MNDEVVVVGAGPVGLVVALLLADRGLPVIVVEAHDAAVAPEWRGSTVHPPTLRLLDHLDLAASVINGGVRVDVVQYRDLELPGVASFEYALLDGLTPFPFRVQFEQYKLLRTLRDRAAAHDRVDLRFGHRVTALAARDNTVEVTVESSAQYHLTAGWVVGADGSHSTVRKVAGVPFPGTAALDPSVVVATPFDFAATVDDLAPVCYCSGAAGRASLIRTPDVWRVALSADAALQAVADRTDVDARPQPVPEVTQRLAPLTGGQPVELRQLQHYRNHHRVAERFRQDQVLLAGDAAHVTSTTGGMGLNSGIHDAFDLAARLVPVIRHHVPSSEMDGYAAVRRQVALDVTVPLTRAATAGVDQRDPEARRRRLDQLGRAARDPDAARAHLLRASMLEALDRYPLALLDPVEG